MPIVSNKANRKFAPLDVSVSVVCASPKSPFMQTMAGNKFFPDRTQSGFECVAYPQINATAKDESWDNKQSNISLANMVWKVSTGTEWKDISKIDAWSGKYSIDTSNTSNRGSLTIKRNLSSNDKQQLQFEADLYDYRTNSILHITADAITLYTADKGADTYGMGIREDTDISYNPFLDKLALYEYKVANNIISASTEERNACFDGNQYECHIPIDVYKSKDRITSGFSIELYRGTTKMSASSAASPNEIISISTSEIVLDLRLVEKNNYTIKAVIDGKAVAQFQFSASRFYPSFSQPKFMVCNDIEWGKMYPITHSLISWLSTSIRLQITSYLHQQKKETLALTAISMNVTFRLMYISLRIELQADSLLSCIEERLRCLLLLLQALTRLYLSPHQRLCLTLDL
jgi:hypothetical protein